MRSRIRDADRNLLGRSSPHPTNKFMVAASDGRIVSGKENPERLRRSRHSLCDPDLRQCVICGQSNRLVHHRLFRFHHRARRPPVSGLLCSQFLHDWSVRRIHDLSFFQPPDPKPRTGRRMVYAGGNAVLGLAWTRAGRGTEPEWRSLICIGESGRRKQ